MSALRLTEAQFKKIAPVKKSKTAPAGKRPKRARSKHTNEQLLLQRQIAALGVWPVELEYRFHSTRRWKFDLALPGYRLAIEIEGGAFVGGRHTRGVGFEKDCHKYAQAMILGWRVLRVTPGMVTNGKAIGYVEKLVGEETRG